MNFCPKCRFMLYTKRVKDDSEDSSDSENYILKNYCKNCDWEGEYNNSEGDKITVYKQNYTNEFLTETALLSQYTINDPTLPRISNIKCVNTNCLTNLQVDDRDIYHCKNLTDVEIEDIKNVFTEVEKINQEELLIILKEGKQEQLSSTLGKYSKKINKFVKPQREIIFMKYDPINLKYMYICSTCKTTWKND